VLHITPVERAVLQLLADGYSVLEIADRLALSESAVESLLPKLYERMGAAGRAEAVAVALRRGLLRHIPTAAPLGDRNLYI